MGKVISKNICLKYLFILSFHCLIRHLKTPFYLYTCHSAHLCVPKALMTVESRRPSFVVTCVTYCALRLSDSSTVLDRAALPVQSHSEPGRWQHSPVVMSNPSRGSRDWGDSGSDLCSLNSNDPGPRAATRNRTRVNICK